ncbi:5-oxoprolinase subunit PxpB [Porticoccus sp.]|uniref:5-oxoprolinase subunit PxpB n=1 Tax=Porticoccus sp. TaxID=2024853 RepID=UPI003F69CA9F
MKVVPASENALIVYFDQVISADTSVLVRQATVALESALAGVLIDLVPSYASLLVIFDLSCIDAATLEYQITGLLDAAPAASGSVGKLVELPVYYSTESGADLADIARAKNLSVEQVIALHQSREYPVYAIGFAPGFAYLGEVDSRIATPRLNTPRAHVPRGSVAIAGRQTAVYPADSPGGWNLIGLCPERMFDPLSVPSTPLQVGDRVRFFSISRETFLTMGGQLP